MQLHRVMTRRRGGEAARAACFARQQEVGRGRQQATGRGPANVCEARARQSRVGRWECRWANYLVYVKVEQNFEGKMGRGGRYLGKGNDGSAC